MVVATVLSDKDDELFYSVEIYGASKREGGSGEKWSCNCPHFTYRRKVCKHILKVKQAFKGTITEGVFLRGR